MKVIIAAVSFFVLVKVVVQAVPINNRDLLLRTNSSGNLPLNSTYNFSDAWAVFYDANGPYAYWGQDEADARAKFHSMDSGPCTRILVNSNKIVMSGGVGGGDANFPTYRGIVGYAIFQNGLVTPASNYPYRVVYDSNGDAAPDHVEFYTDGVAAGESYGNLAARGQSSALIGSDGSITRTTKNYDDIYLQRAVGWDYLCETQFESC